MSTEWIHLAAVGLLAWTVACGGDPDGSATDAGADGSGDGDTDADTDADTDSDTDTEVDPNCEETHEFFVEECGWPEAELEEWDEACDEMADAFTESFMEELGGCLMDVSCEDYNAPGGEEHFEVCWEDSAEEVDAEPANEEFVAHYCEVLVICDPAVHDQEECEDSVFEEEPALKFIGEPYIGQLDACVHPFVECSDAIGYCIDAVIESIPALD